MRAGLPTTTTRGGTSFVTTAPAPTKASSPISMPGRVRSPVATTRGARSISEVAYAWGFNSPAHFSRAFKKQFGMCPSAA